MVRGLLLVRLARRAEGRTGRVDRAGRIGRVGAVFLRDLTAARNLGEALLLATGLLEPLLYLLSIGFGVGGLIGEITLADGQRVPYPVFVAPAMLAASAMSGPFMESSIGFFAKMRFRKLYDATVCTPVTPAEIATGELLWSLAQASLFALSFVVIMTAMGLTTVTGALAALPVAVLIGFAFGGLGLLLATFLTGWQDFDYLGAAVFLMFLFSGTFAPVEDYPTAAQVVVHLTPLFHGVSAVRDLTFGSPGWGLLVHLGYLVGVGVLGLWLASRRISRTLCR